MEQGQIRSAHISQQGDTGLDDLIQRVDKLISVPDIYYRLEAAIQDPSSTTIDYANLLSSDPDLCARLLRIANSAFYSFPVAIDKVDRAINLVGLRQIRELVLATSIMQGFDQHAPSTLDIRQFWRHSIAVAAMGRAIMRLAGLAGSDNCYVPGLLHDIGKLVFILFLPEIHARLIADRKISIESNQPHSLSVLEEQMLGYDHADIGGRLLQHWRVPESIWEPVRCHHSPLAISEYTAVNCALFLADYSVSQQSFESIDYCSEIDTELNNQALEFLKLDLIGVDQLWVTVKTDIDGIIRQFLNH